MSVPPVTSPSPARRRALLALPLLAAAGAGAGFLALLRRPADEGARGLPSALLGRRPPALDLAPPAGSALPPLAAADLAAPLPGPVLVNFWASWCVPCVVEHPQLLRLSREGVPVWGVNYKDRPEAAAAFLVRHGNPFGRLGADGDGRAAIEWGVYGVPETYLLDRAGLVRWRWPGPVTPEVLEQDLRPLLRRHA